MQRKRLEQIKPVQPTHKKEYAVTAQTAGGVLLLDVFKNGSWHGRQAIHTQTGEYAQYSPQDKKWYFRMFGNLLGLDMAVTGWYYTQDTKSRTNIDTADMKKLIREELGNLAKIPIHYDIFDGITYVERQYSAAKRERIEDNRVMKVQDKMRLVPAVPEKARDWIWEMEGAEQYIFRDDKKRWHCSACKKIYSESRLRREDDNKTARHNDRVTCPECGAAATAKTRTDRMEKKSHFYLAQRIDDRMSVWRSFDARLTWGPTGRKTVLNEGFRIIIYSLSIGPKYAGEIFYNQFPTSGGVWHGKMDPEKAYFDNKKNPANRRGGEGFMYPEGIGEAFTGTAYEHMANLASEIARSNLRLDYNRMISIQKGRLTGIIEYLYKGRFWKMLEETVNHIWLPTGGYYGDLHITGTTQEEIFGLSDRQMINRLREENGGQKMLSWLRYSERKKIKIDQETLRWLEKNKVDESDLNFLGGLMTPRQIMNYVTRQQAEGYKGRSTKGVLTQWNDYLSMLVRLGKKFKNDEMMYRPRELKRRHDECVEEINAQAIRNQMARNAAQRRQKSKEMNQRFPGAEKVLREIRDKYAYEDDRFLITVPRHLIDIITEGQALHHCAGATDRYFDRIMQRETYICFLRKKDDPDTPYYTIEVEPDGTIRQHRGYLDEEPNIEQIKPFLRKWQKEIRKRMTEEDKAHAAASAVKRQQNIQELREKNNTRVLRGLMEDFMPAQPEPDDTLEEKPVAAGA